MSLSGGLVRLLYMNGDEGTPHGAPRRAPARLGDLRLLCFVFACALGARTARVLSADPDAASRLPVRPVRIDVNRAPVDALAALPGVGPTLARRIDTARRSEAFRDAGDMARVPGIGPVAVVRLSPHVRFGAARGGR